MALITCPQCGKKFSDRAQTCPQCGISKKEVLLLIHKRDEEIRLAIEREEAECERRQQEFFAELEAKRIEREAKEAEEACIRAEERAKWWAENKKKVGITILILIGIIAAIIIYIKITHINTQKKYVAEAYAMIEQGEKYAFEHQYNEARECYEQALEHTSDANVIKLAQEKQLELTQAEAYTMIEQGEKYVFEHQYNEAREYYEQALQRTNDANIIKLVQEKQLELTQTEKQYPFTSPDLKWAGVQGYVKMIQEHIPRTPLYSARDNEYKFDKKGNLTSLTINRKIYQIERLPTGQIEYITEADDEGPSDGTSFTLNSGGFVIQKYDVEREIVSETSYVLNNMGIPVSAECKQMDNAEDNVLQKYSFKYSHIDTHGNWKEQNTQLTLMYETPQVVNYTTSRTITYYDDNNSVQTPIQSTIDENEWIYGTWKCRTPYGTIKVILRKDGRMYDSVNEGWYIYTIEGNRIIEQCSGYISTYNIDRANERFDCGEPDVWFYKE